MPKNQFQRPLPVNGNTKALHGRKPLRQHKAQLRHLRQDNSAMPALPALNILLGHRAPVSNNHKVLVYDHDSKDI